MAKFSEKIMQWILVLSEDEIESLERIFSVNGNVQKKLNKI
ncbi:MAG: hypothetical protein V1891_00140 [bacterium]